MDVPNPSVVIGSMSTVPSFRPSVFAPYYRRHHHKSDIKNGFDRKAKTDDDDADAADDKKSRSLCNIAPISVVESQALGQLPAKRARRILTGEEAFIRRLTQTSVLDAHRGCVNRLAWNPQGTVLASVSDDCHACLWSLNSRTKLCNFRTQHTANIFGIAFMGSDARIATGAMDCQVQFHNLETNETTKKFECHEDRVKNICGENGNPHLIWTAGEDGKVMQLDERQPHDCNNRGGADCRHAILFRRRSQIKSVNLNQSRPWQLAVGCSERTVAVYDRRYPDKPFRLFIPEHLQYAKTNYGNVTHVAFGNTGRFLVANYHAEDVYVFSMEEGVTAQDSIQMLQISARKERFERQNRLNAKTEHFKNAGNDDFKEGKFAEAIQKYTKAINAGGNMTSILYSNRAAALMKKAEAGDLNKAVADCCNAIRYDRWNMKARFRMVQALHASNKIHAAKRGIKAFMLYFPESESTIADLKGKVLSSNSGDGDDGYDSDCSVDEKWAAKTAPNAMDADMDTRGEEEELYYGNDEEEDEEDEEDEEEEEEEEEDGNEEDESRSNTHDAEMRENNNSNNNTDNDDDEEEFGPSRSEMEEQHDHRQPPHAHPQTQRHQHQHQQQPPPKPKVPLRHEIQWYSGSCNLDTDIKEASFFGLNDDYVVAGSDDGRAIIWNAATGKLVRVLQADADVVNCVQPHPHYTLLATSGIETTVKLWESGECSDDDLMTEEALEKICTQNGSRQSYRDNYLPTAALPAGCRQS